MAKAFLTLSFDDAYQSSLRLAIPLLNKSRFRATINYPAGLSGQYLEGGKIATWEEVKKYASGGHEIASHTLTHKALDFSNLYQLKRFFSSFIETQNKIYYLKRVLTNTVSIKPKTQISHLSDQEEIFGSRRIIEDQTGKECLAFVYPYGFVNEKTKAKARSTGYLSARGLRVGINDPQKMDHFDLKVFSWDSQTSASQARRMVEKAIKENGWLIECFHVVARQDKKKKTNYNFVTDCSEFIQHLKDLKKMKIKVVTQSEMMIKR